MKDDSLDQFLHDSLRDHSSDFQSDWDQFSEKLSNAKLDNFLSHSLASHETPSDDWSSFENKLANSALEFEFLRESFDSHETPVNDWSVFEAKLSATSPEDEFLKDSLANHETEISDWAAFESKLNTPVDSADSFVESAFSGHETAVNDWYSFLFKLRIQSLGLNTVGFLRSMSVAATVLVGLFCWWLLDAEMPSIQTETYSAQLNEKSASLKSSNSNTIRSISGISPKSKVNNTKQLAEKAYGVKVNPSTTQNFDSKAEKGIPSIVSSNVHTKSSSSKGTNRNRSSKRTKPTVKFSSASRYAVSKRFKLETNLAAGSNPTVSANQSEGISTSSSNNNSITLNSEISTEIQRSSVSLSSKKSYAELPFKSVALQLTHTECKPELIRELKEIRYPQNYGIASVNALNFRELVKYPSISDLNRNIAEVTKGSKAIFAPGLMLNLGYHKALYKGFYGTVGMNFTSFETRTAYNFETHEIPVFDSATNTIIGYIPKEYEFSGVLNRKTTSIGLNIGVGKSFNFGRFSLSPEASFGLNRVLSVSGSEINGLTLGEVAINQARVNSSLFSYRFGLTAGYWITSKWGVDLNLVSGKSWSNYRTQIGEHSDLGSIFGGGISFKYCLFNH